MYFFKYLKNFQYLQIITYSVTKQDDRVSKKDWMLSQLAEWFLKEKTENCAAVEKAFYRLALPVRTAPFPTN